MPPFVAMKAAMGAADPTKESRNDDRSLTVTECEPLAQLHPKPIMSWHELQLYGYRPFQDDPDPRPLCPKATGDRLGGIAAIFDSLAVSH